MGEITLHAPGNPDVPYWSWQQRLEQAFLQPSSAREPFAMFLDEEEARRVWPTDDDPAGSLAGAVSAVLDWAGTGGHVFGPLIPASQRWEDGDRSDPPPTLPLLAVTVMAACQMHHDSSASSAAYFIRLAQVLRPGLAPQELQYVRSQLSSGFDVVAHMWRQLDRWIGANSDRFGPSTIKDHPHWTRIGYPLSQAIIKRSDRTALTVLFSALDVTGRGVPEAPALLQYVRLWAARPRGLSVQFTRALADSRNQGILEEHLHRLATAWDGIVLTADGRRRLEFRFVIDLDEGSVRWAIPLVEGVVADALVLDDGEELRISRPAYGSFYQLDGRLPTVSQGLARRMKGKSRRCAAAADPQPIMALREDADAGAWLSVAGVQPFEDNLLVVEPYLRAELEQVLGSAAEPGWKVIPQTPPGCCSTES